MQCGERGLTHAAESKPVSLFYVIRIDRASGRGPEQRPTKKRSVESASAHEAHRMLLKQNQGAAVTLATCPLHDIGDHALPAPRVLALFVSQFHTGKKCVGALLTNPLDSAIQQECSRIIPNLYPELQYRAHWYTFFQTKPQPPRGKVLRGAMDGLAVERSVGMRRDDTHE